MIKLNLIASEWERRRVETTKTTTSRSIFYDGTDDLVVGMAAADKPVNTLGN